MDEIGWQRYRDALQIDGSRYGQASFHIAIEVIDNANLLHLGREVVVDCIQRLLQGNGGRHDSGQDNSARPRGNH